MYYIFCATQMYVLYIQVMSFMYMANKPINKLLTFDLCRGMINTMTIFVTLDRLQIVVLSYPIDSIAYTGLCV